MNSEAPNAYYYYLVERELGHEQISDDFDIICRTRSTYPAKSEVVFPSRSRAETELMLGMPSSAAWAIGALRLGPLQPLEPCYRRSSSKF